MDVLEEVLRSASFVIGIGRRWPKGGPISDVSLIVLGGVLPTRCVVRSRLDPNALDLRLDGVGPYRVLCLEEALEVFGAFGTFLSLECVAFWAELV